MCRETPKVNTLGKRGIRKNFTNVLMEFLFLFGSAGTLLWVRGWIFIGYRFSYQVIYLVLLLVVNPQLLNERGKFNLKETKPYDKYFVFSYFVLGPAMLVLAGLNVRFQWPSIPVIAVYPSIAVIILTTIIALWAQRSNSHFILTMRKDTLGTQRVCTTGPYKYVRHPGYLAMSLQWMCYPFVLGSWLGLIPAFLYTSLIFIRTYYEDKTLKAELKGYEEYSRMTKYRLFPFVW
jgi:protein-S-isoprenylcysteine O-methyltransferase Ste14